MVMQIGITVFLCFFCTHLLTINLLFFVQHHLFFNGSFYQGKILQNIPCIMCQHFKNSFNCLPFTRQRQFILCKKRSNLYQICQKITKFGMNLASQLKTKTFQRGKVKNNFFPLFGPTKFLPNSEQLNASPIHLTLNVECYDVKYMLPFVKVKSLT